MLIESKLKALRDLVRTSTKEEIIWMNGYLSGIAFSETEKKESPALAKTVKKKITIAFGTETGNSKKLATDFTAKAKKIGINAKLVSLDQYRLNDLQKEEYFLTVISTHGDGEPPAAAKKFYDHIHGQDVRLDKLKYGVLALGDTAYPLFGKAGQDVDAQFNKLGATPIVPLQICDTDYEAAANTWFDNFLKAIGLDDREETGEYTVVEQKSTGKKIYTGTVLNNINLNDEGSAKQTHHIEIAAENITYSPGDSLGIVPENPLHIVKEIIVLGGIDQDKTIQYRNQPETFFNLLKKKLNIFHLPERTVKRYAEIAKQDIPVVRIDLLDLLKIYPVKDSTGFEEVIGILEPIVPRLYSISSSPSAHGDEVHITVARNSFEINGILKHGLCSDFLSQVAESAELDFYIHRNNQFRLPEAEKDIILIGPGTGIAPFRSFLAERDATGATGKNWLFFGEQHFATDFLYQTEIQNWVQTGVLTKTNVAFSRDQQEKIYVQHKIHKHGSEFFEWLESGAYIYVCGTKEPMSVDVENTILHIIQQHGNHSSEKALEYLNKLKEEGRYLKDVY